MTPDDLLQAATGALRRFGEEHSRDADDATRARVLAGVAARQQRRRRLGTAALIAASGLMASTVWAGASSRLPAIWKTVVGLARHSERLQSAQGPSRHPESPPAPLVASPAPPPSLPATGPSPLTAAPLLRGPVAAPSPSAPVTGPSPLTAASSLSGPVAVPSPSAPVTSPAASLTARPPRRHTLPSAAPHTVPSAAPHSATSAAPHSVPSAAPHSASSAPAPDVDDAEARSETELFKVAHHTHFGARDPAAALAAWDRYLAAAPAGRYALEAAYDRALCLVRLGRRDDAIAALGPFADGAPGNYRRREARQLIDALRRTSH
jgi:hypothetical protein